MNIPQRDRDTSLRKKNPPGYERILIMISLNTIIRTITIIIQIGGSPVLFI
jgi:hypothetical protein